MKAEKEIPKNLDWWKQMTSEIQAPVKDSFLFGISLATAY